MRQLEHGTADPVVAPQDEAEGAGRSPPGRAACRPNDTALPDDRDLNNVLAFDDGTR